jgi:AMP-polyphosphate phosphotransferase
MPRGASPSAEAAAPTLPAALEQLSGLQLAQIVHKRRAIIVLEGPEGAGKKEILRLIAGSFDPCHFLVHCIDYDRRTQAEGHWLARFWTRLPAAGSTAIFFHSWYRRVLDDRILGRVTPAEWTRAYDEINEFEAQQNDYGTLLVKLYLNIDSDVQVNRLAERAAHPWQRWTLPAVDQRMMVGDPGYNRAFDELLSQTDTRWAPWTVIDGNNAESARLKALNTVAAALAGVIPNEAPREPPAARPSQKSA